MIRVIVVDDEALVRSGFRLILSAAEDIDVIATVDGPSAVEAVMAGCPDVVLLDIRMPGRSGLEILNELQTLADPPVVAILTTFDTDDYIGRALGAGAAGFLVKDTDPEQLPTLVRSLAAGGIVLSPQVSKTVIDTYLGASHRATTSRVDFLSHRERQVLARLATGESNTEIGNRLHLSVGTIKDHVSAILQKLDVSTRLQAALIADRSGLLKENSEQS